MQDPPSDLVFRPQSAPVSRRDDAAWEAVVREELLKLRRRTPRTPRVVAAARQAEVDPGSAEPPAG
jgi:hypothetical protein